MSTPEVENAPLPTHAELLESLLALQTERAETLKKLDSKQKDLLKQLKQAHVREMKNRKKEKRVAKAPKYNMEVTNKKLLDLLEDVTVDDGKVDRNQFNKAVIAFARKTCKCVNRPAEKKDKNGKTRNEFGFEADKTFASFFSGVKAGQFVPFISVNTLIKEVLKNSEAEKAPAPKAEKPAESAEPATKKAKVPVKANKSKAVKA